MTSRSACWSTRPDLSTHSGKTGTFSPAVIAPTYNNAQTLCDILDRLERLGYPLIVVNDGSTDATAEQLSTWTDHGRTVPVTVVTHARNRGKAAAMRSGFNTAKAAGHSHVATMDTDGQLDPEDIPALFRTAAEFRDAIVLGMRRRDIPDCPKSSHFAWWLTALGIFLETGCRVLDSQCGLRVYPLHVIELIRCRSSRYAFESEVITRALWAGCSLVPVPVTCRYLPLSQRVSHFKPWRDGMHSFFMHFALTVRQVIPWPKPRLDRNAGPGGIIDQRATARESAKQPFGIRKWWNWIDPLAVWRQVRTDRFEQLLVAAALGIGAFVGNIPLGGWQILLAAYVAKRTHVHAIPVVATSLLCLSSVGEGLSKMAIGIGYLLLHFSLPDLDVLVPEHLPHWQRLALVPVAWPIGAIIVGFFCTWIVLPIFERLFRLIPVRKTLGQS